MKIIRSRNAKMIAGVSVLAGVGFVALQSEPVQETSKLGTPKKIQEITIGVEAQPLAETANMSPDDAPLAIEDRNDPFEGREVKYRFQQIASHFAQEIKYPTFSRPIHQQQDLVEYLPNRAVQSSRPINLDDVDGEIQEVGPRIALKTSKFNYYPGEPVVAVADVTGIQARNSVHVTGLVRVGGQIVAKNQGVIRSDDGSNHAHQQYSLHFDDLSNIPVSDQGDMDVVAEFTIDGNTYAITSLIRYPKTVASIEGLGEVEVEGEYLKIPMQVTTSAPGLHAIKANLYAADLGTPLVHLNTVEELNSESGVLLLKAHIAALKNMGHEGPYELRDLSFTRGASAPKYTVEQGLVGASTYPVAGFSFSEYDDVPYIDESAQSRLDFLNQLGSTH